MRFIRLLAIGVIFALSFGGTFDCNGSSDEHDSPQVVSPGGSSGAVSGSSSSVGGASGTLSAGR